MGFFDFFKKAVIVTKVITIPKGEKKMKRAVSIILSLIIVLSCNCVPLSASAADTFAVKVGTNGIIRFDASKWSGFSLVYCHIWERDGDSFFPWQSKKETCKKVDSTIYEYDLSILDKSTTITSGLQSDKDYCIIFSANTGLLTYDITFGTDCIGDTAKVTGNKIENPIDSEKEAFEAVWTNNSTEYGPHFAISSIGNLIGKNLCPHERIENIIGDWVSVYYKYEYSNAAEAIAKALNKFNINSTDSIYRYVTDKNTNEDLTEIKKVLKDAEKRAFGSLSLAESSATLFINDKYTILPDKGKREGTVSFKSNNKKIATVNSKGVVKAKKAGKTTITVSFFEESLKFTVIVKKPSVFIAKKLTLPSSIKKTLKAITFPSKKGKVTWSSSNKKIASISKNGKLKTKSAGTAIITARFKYKGKTYKSKCKLIVKKVDSVKELAKLLYNSEE